MTDHVSPITLTCVCKNCSKEFTFEKTVKGGRPRKHCSEECKNRYRDRTRSYAEADAFQSMQASYFAINCPRNRIGYLQGLFTRYARAVAGMDSNALTKTQRHALVNAFLFKSSGEVSDTLTKKMSPNLFHIFAAFCLNTKAANPMDPYSVIMAAGLADEVIAMGKQMPKPKSVAVKRSAKVYSNKADNVVSYEARRAAKDANKIARGAKPTITKAASRKATTDKHNATLVRFYTERNGSETFSDWATRHGQGQAFIKPVLTYYNRMTNLEASLLEQALIAANVPTQKWA